MQTLLIQPPQSDPAQPYSSLGVLLGAWRHAGLDVDVLDLNLDFFNHITSPTFISERLELIKKRLKDSQFKDDTERDVLLRAGSLERWILSGVETAKNILKSENLFYDAGAYAWAIRTISRGLEVISAPSYPGRISLQSFRTAFSHHSSVGIQRAIEDEHSNLFLRYCDEVVVPKIVASSPDIIALSVTFQTQLIPAWTIAARVKRVLPGVRVVVGGATISRIRDGLARAPALFKDVDAAVLYEGETAFVALVEEWARGKSGLDAPNVMLSLNGSVQRSLKIHTENLDELPSPDHAGLPLDAYWWPKPALLINSARGCYYGRCAFCMISPATWGPTRMGSSYRVRSTDKVIDDLCFAHRQTGATAFNLANDVLSPKMLGEIGDAVKSSGLPLTWDSEIRLEKSLSRPVLERMSAGGCRHLRFGFETASERVSHLMAKGTTLAAAQRILLDCRDLGISVGFLCQMGFPGETVDEAAQTAEFLANNNDRIAFVSLTQFALETGSGVHQKPGDFGVSLLEIPSSEDLAWTHPYSRADGITLEDTGQLFDEMEAVIDRSYPDRDLFFKGGLGHAHTTLYTRRYGASQFLEWNKASRRAAAADLSDSICLRTARDLSITTSVDARNEGSWTQVIISTAEVPEHIFIVNGFVLLLLFAATVPRKTQDLIDWSRETFRQGDAGEDVVHTLYNAGLLIAEQADSRHYAFDDMALHA